MKSNNWKDFAELIGIAAIVASLMFVGLQMRQAEVIAKSDMAASYLANRIEMHAAINEHPDIWVRGNKGEELEEGEAAIFSRQVLMLNDEAYYSVQQSIIWGQSENTDLDAAIFAAYLHENPGARRVWRAQEDWNQNYRSQVMPGEQITSDWIQRIESNLALFDRTTSQ
jgi:hypothetical protein